MTKLNNPLLGLKAHGSLGNAITFQKRGSGTMARQKPFPTDPKTLAQIYHRWDYQDYAAWWHTLPDATKRQWEIDARRKKITGFNYWMSTRLATLPDLVGRWHLDQHAGSLAPDSSKNNNPGTIYGASYIDGLIGDALLLDGLDDYVNIPHHATLNTDNDFTILIAFKTTSTNFGVIFEKYGTPGPVWFIFYYTGTRIRIGIKDVNDNYPWKDLYGNYKDGEWHKVAFRRDTQLHCFVDGEEHTDSPWIDTTDSSILNSHPIRIGTRTTGVYPFAATIDEPKILNRALSDIDIKRLSERRYPQ